MKFDELKVNDWCWFFSSWHGHVVMGQICELVSAALEPIHYSSRDCKERIKIRNRILSVLGEVGMHPQWCTRRAERAIFHKVVETDGSHASWKPTARTSIKADDIIRCIRNNTCPVE